MVTPEIIDYIKQSRAAGKIDPEITDLLTTQGWSEADILQAFTQLQNPPPTNEIPKDIPAMYVASPPANPSLPGVTDLLRETFELYQRKLTLIIGIGVPPMIMAFLIGILPQLLFPDLYKNNTSAASDALKSLASARFLSMMMLSLILGVVTFVISTLSAIGLVLALGKENMTVKSSYRLALSKFLPYWWFIFLISLVEFGGMLLIIPVILTSVWFTFAIYVFTLEDLRGLDAFVKCREYARGFYWPIAWRVFFVSFFVGIIGFFAQMATAVSSSFQSISSFLTKNPASTATVAPGVFQVACASVIQLLLAPISVIFIFLLYQHLKALRPLDNISLLSSTRTKFKVLIIFGLVCCVILPFLGILTVGILSAVNPAAQIRRAAAAKTRNNIMYLENRLMMYKDTNNSYPDTLSLINLPNAAILSSVASYKPTNAGQDFELCFTYENATPDCDSEQHSIFDTVSSPIPIPQ